MRLDDYMRFDIGISWKVNRPKSTRTLAINVQNVIGRANEFERFYSFPANAVVSESQVGLFPTLSDRISF